MKNLLFTFSIILFILTSCVSTKKYNLLETAYQKAGNAQRNYEQEHKILQVELLDLKQKIERLETSNTVLDSVNHGLHQRIMGYVSGNWQAKYETLLAEFEKIASPSKMRGDEPAPKQKMEVTIAAKKGKLPPPIAKFEKAYSDKENSKEVKLPTKPKDKEDTKIEPKLDNTAKAKEEPILEPIAENNAKTDELNLKIQAVLDKCKFGEEAKKNQDQNRIALLLSDGVLFENEDSHKFSAAGEELLNGLVYVLSKYPNTTIDLVSEGYYATEKTKEIAKFLAQYNIKTRTLAKNAMPLAFETSGTQRSVCSLIMRVE